jgi:VPDSG-CTERM motif
MKKLYITACLVGITTLYLESDVRANVIFNDARTTGNQQLFDLGMDFTVNSAVTVTALGTFDANLNAVVGDAVTPPTQAQIAQSLLAGPNSSGVDPNIYVGIFKVNANGTGTLVSPQVVFNTAGAISTPYFAIAGSIFQAITAFTLGPGTYSIVATGYTFDLKSGNTALGSPIPTFDTLGGALTLLPNGGRFDPQGINTIAPLVMPTFTSGVSDSPTFLAGTFIATNNDRTNVPDGGSTIALLGFAILTIGSLSRKFSH